MSNNKVVTSYLTIDFETYSDVSISDGLDNYFASPNFKILLMAVAYADVIDVYDYNKLKDIESLIITPLTLVKGVAPLTSVPLTSALLDPFVPIFTHNAMFEQMCLKKLGFDLPSDRFIDTAVLARANGYSSGLDSVMKQLVVTGKIASAPKLMQRFCFPSKLNDFMQEFDTSLPEQHPTEWEMFKTYVTRDVRMALDLTTEFCFSAARYMGDWSRITMQDSVTRDMNLKGWPVDLELLDIFSEQTEKQVQLIKRNALQSGIDINLNSPKQIMDYCTERKVALKSTNITTVVPTINQLVKALDNNSAKSVEQENNWREVLALLTIVVQLSKTTSLAKLSKIKEQVGPDDRLRNQYMHFGAGQTGRTTGVGVQLQNLTRIASNQLDVEELKATYSKDTSIGLNVLSANMRQLFRSSHEQGKLIVGDFSSIESRGLAWLTGENWKLKAYFDKRPIYEELAASFFSIPVEDVDPEQRTFGKVGELACGYGSGPSAVKDFAAKMGIDLSAQDANMIVNSWRSACAATVEFGQQLQDLLFECVANQDRTSLSKQNSIGNGFKTVTFEWLPQKYILDLDKEPTPYGKVIATITTYNTQTRQLMTFYRVFHGVHLEGNKLFYIKPSSTKTGPPWIDNAYIPATKTRKKFSLYAGKLLGILTQSMCYEIFMLALQDIAHKIKIIPNVDLIGQFHDEIVLDWWPSEEPNAITEVEAKRLLEEVMSVAPFVGFPMACEIKSAHTYTK